MPGEHLSSRLLVAVDQKVAPFRVSVAHDAEGGSREADLLGTEEGQPAKDRSVGDELAAGPSRRAAHCDSSKNGFLCLGFLRLDFGSMVLADGTRPTRSRAMAFTSLPRSKLFFLRGKHPPDRACQGLRSERFVQKEHAAGRTRLERGHIHRIAACGD